MSRTAWGVAIGVAIVLLIAFVACLFLPQGLGSRYGYGSGGMMGPWMMSGFGIFGMLGGLFVLALLVGGTVWLIQSASHGRGVIPTVPREETPLEILKRRYANGDISKDQYEEMRRDLGS